MADEPMTEADARRRFVAYLVAVDAQGPVPDSEEQLAAIFAEHEAECERIERELAETEKQKRRS
ncbi:MAG: hypothetical protein ACRYGP_10650 [Janthinobacterium lividum]